MGIEEMVTLFVNNGTAIAVIIYFIYRDNKFMQTLQSTLTSLVETVDTLHETVKYSCDIKPKATSTTRKEVKS